MFEEEDNSGNLASGSTFHHIKIDNCHGQVTVGGSKNVNIAHIHHGSSNFQYPQHTKQNRNVAQVSVPDEIKNSKNAIKTENMFIVAQNVSEWKMLARFLPGANFEPGDIATIEYDHSKYGLAEIVYQMLQKWKERSPDEATVGSLAHALENIQYTHVACKLKP